MGGDQLLPLLLLLRLGWSAHGVAQERRRLRQNYATQLLFVSPLSSPLFTLLKSASNVAAKRVSCDAFWDTWDRQRLVQPSPFKRHRCTHSSKGCHRASGPSRCPRHLQTKGQCLRVNVTEPARPVVLFNLLVVQSCNFS